jgi:hypothetical protein
VLVPGLEVPALDPSFVPPLAPATAELALRVAVSKFLATTHLLDAPTDYSIRTALTPSVHLLRTATIALKGAPAVLRQAVAHFLIRWDTLSAKDTKSAGTRLQSAAQRLQGAFHPIIDPYAY